VLISTHHSFSIGSSIVIITCVISGHQCVITGSPLVSSVDHHRVHQWFISGSSLGHHWCHHWITTVSLVVVTTCSSPGHHLVHHLWWHYWWALF